MIKLGFSRYIGFQTLLFIATGCATVTAEAHEQKKAVDEVVIWGNNQDSNSAGYTSPTSLITPEDIVTINVATTEDVVKYEPSIVIRRRYIGDSNGTLGLRGSNMFQTSRSMVFADGVPLHYLLQTRWNGAPRWTMVSASEIAQVEIIYGPFSAEYSGNAMGGVVVIETAIPQEQEFHVDASYFSQSFDAYGFDDNLNGYKGFMSYGDKVGDFSYYMSYNRLENESQPQSYYGGGDGNTALSTATGSIVENNAYGNALHYYSDSGVENAETNNYKIKLGYDFGDWFALLNVAYEDRTTLRDSATPYLRDASGNPIYSGNVDLIGGGSFNVQASRFSESELNRDSLNVGLRLKGDLTESISLEANINEFVVLRDETRSSDRNSADQAYTLDGKVDDFGDTGWSTADVKLTVNDLGMSGLTLISGLRYEAYELNLNQYDSTNYLAGNKDSINNRSGGETAISAAFTQMNWDINTEWDMSIGGRFESWKSRDGYFSQGSGAGLTIVDVPSRSDNQFSPKFSLGYKPLDVWTFRYSVARAYRFPVVEELFNQYRGYNSQVSARPDLKPENGLHHNIMAEYTLEQGYLRVNLFQENIQDAIESFSSIPTATTPSITTFHSMEEVETKGIEFVANAYNWLADSVDIRFNLAYIDSEIVKNRKKPEWEGNTMQRMPKWRGNLLATYHVTEKWNVGASVQYASDSYGRFENDDNEDNVYGAQDGYTRLGLKTTFDINVNFKIGFGIDNLTNEITYVAHPWPGRTAYFNVSYDL